MGDFGAVLLKGAAPGPWPAARGKEHPPPQQAHLGFLPTVGRIQALVDGGADPASQETGQRPEYQRQAGAADHPWIGPQPAEAVGLLYHAEEVPQRELGPQIETQLPQS